MNKKENQRYTETEHRIDGVFMELLKQKELKDITVSEICRMSRIHRTTFYGHYTDVYDLMHKMLGRAYERIMEGFMQEENFSLQQGFLETFRLVRDNKVFFKYYLENKEVSGFEFIRIPSLLENDAESVAKKMGYTTVDEMYYHQTFFNGGLRAILRYWISRDCKESPEEMCRLISEEYRPNRKQFG